MRRRSRCGLDDGEADRLAPRDRRGPLRRIRRGDEDVPWLLRDVGRSWAMKGDTRLTGAPCLRCKRELVSLGSPKFRIGGSGGAAHLLFGNWAELGESTVELEVLACDSCGQ